MRKTAKFLAGAILAITATFAGTAAASAATVGGTEPPGDPCGEDAPYGMVPPILFVG